VTAGTDEVPAERTSRAGIFHGWKIVGASSVVQALHSGLIIQAFGNYAVLLEREFGWSRTVFSVAYSFNRAESGLLGPIQGWALQRFGSRRIMRIGVVVLTLGFLLFSLVQTPIQFIGAFFVMAVGAGLSGFLTLTSETVRWFERKRARALSFVSVGFAVGGLVAPAVVWVLRTAGWRQTAAGSAVLVFVVAWSLTSLFGGWPADRGEHVDGVDPADRPPERFRPAGVSDVHFTASEAVRTRAFWMISLGHASALLVVGSVIAHLSLYLTDEQGFELQEASYVGAGLTAFQLIGMLSGGFLGDRMSKRLLCGVAMLGHMTGLLLLTFAEARWMIWLFVVFHGLAWGVRGPLMGAMRADYFGATSFGQIMGISSVILMVGIVGGPLLAGILADVTNSYATGFTILALLAGAGLGFFVLATPPAPPARSQPPPAGP
jgi:MFS family permease